MKLKKNRDDLYEIGGLLQLLCAGNKLKVIPYNKGIGIFHMLAIKWRIEI